MLSNVDRELLQRCLGRSSDGWNDFVDRYMVLVRHVVLHSGKSRAIPLDQPSIDELISDVFFEILENDFAVLRRFRLESSLGTYLTVIARRIVMRQLGKKKQSQRRERRISLDSLAQAQGGTQQKMADRLQSFPQGSDLETREEIEAAISALAGDEATAVRMYFLEGKNYHDISLETGLSENSIGPYLTRAKEKMRLSRIANS